MKPRILFFPTAWSTKAMFAPQVQALQTQYECIFPKIDEFDTIEAMANHVVNTYQNVYALVGASMGGFTVQQILSRHPNFAHKAILMGTYANAHDDNTKAFFQSLIDQVNAGQLESIIPFFLKAVISKTHEQDATLCETISAMPRALGAAHCINHHKACISWQDHSQLVKNIIAKTLILAGEEDPAVPVSALETLHTLIPHSQLKIIPNAGHVMTLEEPALINKAFETFLNA